MKTTKSESIGSSHVVKMKQERSPSNSEVQVIVGMHQNVSDQMGRSGYSTILF